jgi:carbonic anhydrase/acetyltransferase-like protein (isoleucine patch superfamily)
VIYQLHGVKPLLEEGVYIAPNAVVIGKVIVRQEASIWFSCVVRGDINSISIGQSSNIQDGAILHVTQRHSLSISERVTVGHGAILHGCHVEDDCLIGMGAIVLDGAVIGKGSIVAAGSVVAPGTVVPPASMVMGAPGKVMRGVKEEETALIALTWQSYVSNARDFAKNLDLV